MNYVCQHIVTKVDLEVVDNSKVRIYFTTFHKANYMQIHYD